jgi:hypothetical protein
LNALLPDQAGSTQYMLLTDGSGTVSWGAQPVAGLPSQTSNSGRLLTTNGSTASWSNAVTVSGSNATVGGTLTVSGAGTSSFAGNVQIPNATNYVVRNAANTSTAMRMYADSSDYGYVDATANTELRLQVGAGTKLSIGSTGIVTIPGTTASTSTSSGALVVSGGVGVAGNVSSGGQVAATGTGTSGPYIANSAVLDYDSSTARFYGRGPNTSTRPSLGFYSTYSDGAGGLTLMTFNASGVASIPATTASTSTSSGALVVSGGVGVAKRIFTGEGLDTAGDNATHISFVRNGTVSIGPDAAATPSLVVSTTLKISGTTASTSTSSGALVVGNGTSGGLGVGGAIWAGGYLSTGSHARIGAQSSVVALSANNNVDGGLPAAWTGNYGVGVQYLGSSSNAFFIGDGSGGSTYFYTRTGSANTARLSIDNTNGNVTIGGTLQVGNAYVGGAPTATGYIVIKDSTGTSYKIPAVAL